MRYGEFISIFKKDYNLDYFYVKFLKKKKEIKSILKEDVDNEFSKFLLKNNIEKEEEIKVFFDLYNNKFNLDIIYLSYRNNFINLKYLKNIKNMDDFKHIVLNKYKNYLKIDIDKIDDIDLENIIIFLRKYPEFYKNMKGNKYSGNIDLYNLEIKKDLTFLKILGIEEINGFFDCSNNSNLKSLKGSSKRVNGLFNCSWCGLEELGMQEGVKIGGDFDCSNNKKLKSLKGSPQEVSGNFYCKDCGLEELGMQEGVEIGEDFNCSNNRKLKSLKGSPQKVGGIFLCINCGLEELGMQKGVEIDRGFDCSNNKNLKTLKGCPSLVKGNFYCDKCGLDEIDLDKDITIGKNLICLEGNNVTKKQVEEYIKKNNINLEGEII